MIFVLPYLFSNGGAILSEDGKTLEIDKKETLYKIETCCFCGGSDVTRLSEAEQLEVIGSKNNHYTMKFRCNNPKCNYYW